MTNFKYYIGSADNQPPGGWGYMKYIIADVDSAKPVTGLHTGDLCWASDTALFYVATSPTTWAQIPFTYREQTWSDTQSFESSALALLSSLGGGSHYLDSLSSVAGAYSYLQNISGMLVTAGYGDDPPLVVNTMGKVNRLAQTAAIASTNLTNTTPDGLYEIAYYLRCTTLDLTAGTIQLNVTYTDSVGATTESSQVVVLTSTASHEHGVIVADLASGNITYSTTLAGIAGTSQYKLRVRCKFLG